MDSVYTQLPGTGEVLCHDAMNIQKYCSGGVWCGSQRYKSCSVGLRLGRLGQLGLSFWGQKVWTVPTAPSISKCKHSMNPSHNSFATYSGSGPEVRVSVFPEQWEIIYLTSLIEPSNIPNP